jgi:hypothetical protein
MRLLQFRGVACSAMLILALVAACGEPFGLGRPSFENRVDTLKLYALNGTPVSTPSAYVLQFRQPVRTDQNASFDFAFDIDAADRPLLLTTGALRLGQGSGVQTSTVEFDSLKFAPDGGYELDSAVVVEATTVALIRSRSTLCTNGITSAFFAKLRVIEIDLTDRSMQFEILVDQNCGFRGLEPGLPSR